ncbi:sensor domain-containing diguanylate cyclase [Sporosarcina sp. NPDC096371]|uniref:sensor domain-containing diguanylate cyclase n=1 Tax=Sporosarcina sp. NPDC096371 TaxID=3364530 RepID=UPI0037FC1EDB
MKGVNRSTIMYFLLWLFIVPPGLYFFGVNYPPVQVDWIHVAIFAILSFLAIYFPVIRNESPLFLVMWLTIPAFLMYGLLIEILIMQIAVLAILFKDSKTLSLSSRFFINSMLFFILSVLASFAFYMVGGEIKSDNFGLVFLSVLAYQLVHTIANDFAIRFYARHKKIKSIYITNEVLMGYAIVLVITPLSLSLYYLIGIVGTGAFLLLAIPFFSITFIVRLYNTSEKINKYLQEAGDIGHEISDKMTEDEIIDQFTSKVSAIFNADIAYLFDHQDGWLEMIRFYAHKQFIDIEFAGLALGQGLAREVLQKNEPLIFSAREEWEMVAKDYLSDELQSLLCVPITRNQKIEGVLLLGSNKKSAFEEYQLKVLDLLCSYFTVSVEKARYIQEAVTKNERCALTGLYNYRYLGDILALLMEQVKNNDYKDLSVVMLDIDYFKNVNDTYGHQSGNDILFQFARKLEAALPENGIVGRYGGEEFVFILPGKSKDEAYAFAEKLRTEIAGQDFLISPDLFDDENPQIIRITCSMGIASTPEDADEAMALLRDADRALYLGAKHAGRNRVAKYAK